MQDREVEELLRNFCKIGKKSDRAYILRIVNTTANRQAPVLNTPSTARPELRLVPASSQPPDSHELVGIASRIENLLPTIIRR